ncbi:MAG TPA: PDR/VanB family oxidoreductase [Acetobacteraceae bacterium]|nr:PDR/VanB family oxidoreductase [Acetobacteraceae bacterium]
MTTLPLSLVVAERVQLSPLIVALRLRDPRGAALPGAAPGAHISLAVPGDAWRHYSLVDFSGGLSSPDEYRIAVRLEDASRGGSRFVHERLHTGETIRVLPPQNDFPLDPGADDPLLIAGGIGITPMTGMVASLARAQRPFLLHYSGRSAGLLAFVPELSRLCGDLLVLHADDDPATALSVPLLIGGARRGRPIYVCGPRGMIEAVIAEATARDWDRSAIRFELFTEAAGTEEDRGFELVLAQSGRTLQVPPDRSIIDVMEDAGLDPMYSCRRGECGVCTTPVLEGEIDHRDLYLSDTEKASGKMMQICISRARGPRLVIDA